MNDNPSRTAIETPSGELIDFLRPDHRAIKMSDIAHMLANTCRFAGATSRFYSVAEHAVLVADILEQVATPDIVRAGLHHDDHEAYVGDLPTPLKQVLGPRYRAVVAGLDHAIGTALDIDPRDFHHPLVQEADQLAMQLEADLLMPGDWAWKQPGRPELPEGVTWHAGKAPPEYQRQRYLLRAVSPCSTPGVM